MDWFPILFDVQLVLMVIVLVIWARSPAKNKRHVARQRRQATGIRCTDGKVIGKPAPAMTAEEIVKVCDSL